MRRHLLRRVIPAVLLAAAATVGGSAVGDPAVACAEPNTGEWDIEKYDACMERARDLPFPDYVNAVEMCCINSGGIFKDFTCTAPPANPQSQPGVAPKPGVATQNPAPPVIRIPQDEITATFAPAPAG
jgi:hypothetical protein